MSYLICSGLDCSDSQRMPYTLQKTLIFLTPLLPRWKDSFPHIFIEKNETQKMVVGEVELWFLPKYPENTHLLIKCKTWVRSLFYVVDAHNWKSKELELECRACEPASRKFSRAAPCSTKCRQKEGKSYMKTAYRLSHHSQIFLTHQLSGEISLKETTLFFTETK